MEFGRPKSRLSLLVLVVKLLMYLDETSLPDFFDAEDKFEVQDDDTSLDSDSELNTSRKGSDSDILQDELL